MFISWEIGVNLPPVNFAFCWQWIPSLTHDVWKYEMLEVMFAAVQQLRSINFLDGVAAPITITHSDFGDVQPWSGWFRLLSKPKIWW
jgi:hypothetical protein